MGAVQGPTGSRTFKILSPGLLIRKECRGRQRGRREPLTVLEEPWGPSAGRFDRGRPLLLAADLPAFRP